jgi:hypothetical protein
MKTNNKKNKIQQLLITHLLEEGSIELTLPDGMKVELGITKEGRNGDLEKCEDYCWLIASQSERSVCMDCYNLGLKYTENGNILIEETDMENGKEIKRFNLM